MNTREVRNQLTRGAFTECSRNSLDN